MSKSKVMIVEDEKAVGNFLSAILTGEGYQVIQAISGGEAMTVAASHNPDVILLDLGLPDMDGGKVLNSLREWSDVPIIVVSARQEESEKVSCLDAGANDYITKPFGNRELLARVRTSLRQHQRLHSKPGAYEREFTAKGLKIDYLRRRVSKGGSQIHLTPIEYKIVVLLSHSAGMVLTHDFILRKVWGPFASDSQLLRVNMANIRRKIEPDPADPKYILTEVGVGYRMIDADE